MTICSNCTQLAQFQYAVSTSLTLYYCAAHLPSFLKGKNAASLLVSKVEVEKEPAPKRKKATKVVEPETEPEETPDEVTEEVADPENGTD
jgi:hypothetical protein